jgi:hypothetical protein
MTKKLSVIFILAFVMLALLATTSFGMTDADKKKYFNQRKIGSMPLAKMAGNEKIYNPITADRNSVNQSLGFDDYFASNSPGLQVGTTTYDYQANGRMNRMVDWRTTQNVHFTWMVQSSFDLGSDRGTSYEYWNASAAPPKLVFQGAAGGGTAVHPRLGGGNNYSGYVGMDMAPDGRIIIYNHHQLGDPRNMSTVWPDLSVGGGFFTPYRSRLPDTTAGYDADPDTSSFIWPSCEIQIRDFLWDANSDPDTVIHVFAQESLSDAGAPQKIHYFRRVGGYVTYAWDYPPLVVDTVHDIGQTVVASRNSNKVWLVWMANPPGIPGASESISRGLQRVNDLFYMMSTDMGTPGTWGSKVNVTAWDSSQPGWVLHTDLSALVGQTDDLLHVIWNAREVAPDPSGGLGTYQHFYGSRLFHYVEGDRPRVVKDANWDLDPDNPCHGGAWNEMSIVKMQLAECDGKFYALFVMFNDIYNGINDDCHNRAFASSEASGTANGELFISISNNSGKNWDIARNLTNSRTPRCDSSEALGGTLECDADMWPAISRYGMQVTTGNFAGVPIVTPAGGGTSNWYLDVFYVNDKHPGGAVQDAGVWTVNPMKWFRVPCVEPVPNPLPIFSPSQIADPTWTKPLTPLDTVVRIENIGNADLHISAVNIFYKAGGPTGWISYAPAVTTIPYLDPNYVDITLTLGTGISTDGIGLTGGMVFISDAPTSPDTLPIYLIVADTVQFPEYAIIHTACSPVYMNNAGKLGADARGNNFGYNMNFYDDCDTTGNVQGGDDNSATYLYESSPFIMRIIGNDTVLFSYIYDANWLQNDGFRPTEGLTVDSTTNSSVMVGKTGKFLTRDSAIVLESEMYASQHPDSCKFFVQKLRVYQKPGATGTLTGLFIGELMDWDIPSDSAVENGSDFDQALQLMYCFGGEYGADSIANNDCVLANDRMGGLAYYGGYRVPHYNVDAFNTDSFPIALGAWTHMNADWVYPSGNFVPQLLYKKMATFSGYEAWEATNSGMEDSLYQDLHMVSIFGQFDLGKNDTLVFVKIFSTTYSGLSDLQLNIVKARKWIQQHDIFQWPPLLENPSCCEVGVNAGDATGDGAINLLDILFLIAYKYNTPPGPGNTDCPELMDPTGDGAVNLLDILYLIAYKYNTPPGPAPLCPPTK